MRILVLQLKRIGDLLLTTPFLNALGSLRAKQPNLHITLCIKEGNAPLIPALTNVDEVLVIRQKGSNASLWAKMALQHYDVCLDLTGNDRSAFLSLLSKAKQRIAFEWVKKSSIRPLFYNRFVDSSVRENHTVDHLIDLLQPLGIERPESPTFEFKVPFDHSERASQILSEHGLSSRYAIIHPGTARVEKYWRPERWAEVINHCQNAWSLPCVITGSPDAFEQEHIAAITRDLKTPCVNLAGKIDLLTLAALIEKSTLLVSMDSAPVHFGALFKTPQVSLFGQTNPFHWHPRHPKSATLLAGFDHPLTQFSSRFQRRPLSDLSTETVIGAISSLLDLP